MYAIVGAVHHFERVLGIMYRRQSARTTLPLGPDEQQTSACAITVMAGAASQAAE